MSKRITLPLTDEALKNIRTGDNIWLTGVIYTGRDATLKRMVETLNQGIASPRSQLPFDIKGQTIYFMGPSPARPGRVIGSAGPTTSSRMESYLLRLIAEGLKGVVGKGMLSQAVKDAMKRHKAVYFAAIGGVGALISQSIKKAKTVAYEELGAEALLRLEVENFPVTVINDIYGGDLYQEGKARFRTQA